MTEQYIAALSDILENSKTVVLPKSSGVRGALDPKTIASAITLYKELLGNTTIRTAVEKSDNPMMLDELQQRLNMLEIETEEKKDNQAKKVERY